VTHADLTVIGDGAGNAEGLQSFTQCFSDIGGYLLAFFNGGGSADQISPAGVFK
jgi:hypothetical protein